LLKSSSVTPVWASRADPARGRDPGGTGLGLPIARWIAQQHGGDLVLESAPGQGTLATIRLPIMSSGVRDGVPSADGTMDDDAMLTGEAGQETATTDR
jgi:hypothetical protein